MGRKLLAFLLALVCATMSICVFTGCNPKPSIEANTDPSSTTNEDPAGPSDTESADLPSGDSTDLPSGDPTDPPSGDPTDPPSGDPTDPPSGDPTDPPSGDPSNYPLLEGVYLSLANQTVTYNGKAWEPEVVGKEQGDTVVFNIKKNGSDVSEAKNAGAYEISATVTREGYQPLTTNTVSLTINKAQAVITAKAHQTFSFDGNYHYVDATLNHKETSLALKSQAFMEIGKYSITLSARETENYLAVPPVTVSAEVIESYKPAAEPSTPGAMNIPASALATEHNGEVKTSGSFSYSGYSTDNSAITLPIYYANSMLLQGNMATKLVGKSNISGNIVVLVTKSGYSQAFYGSTSSSAVGGKYPFEIFIKVPYGVDYTVTFINQNKKARSISDVAFGELFIAGGQSNMGWNMSQCYNGSGGSRYSSDIANSSNGMIRLGSMWPTQNKSPVAYDGVTSYNTWSKANPDKVKEFSAVAYFFVRELQEQYPGVPIGIFSSCMGGTNIYTWMEWDSYVKAINNGWAGSRHSTSDDPGDSNPAAAGARYYNAMINPLSGLTPRGVLWYQGCGHPENYSKLLDLMIQDWRDLFDNQKLWFIDCGLPRYGGEELWYKCRDEHEYASTKIDNLVYSTNVDSGLYVEFVDSKDTLNGDGIHPYEKKPVGEHAAHVAMKHFYGAQGTWGSPEFEKVAVSGSNVYLTLSNVGEGLVLKGLAGFEIAGEDGVFYTATPKLISKTTIMVTCNKVANPVKIRYGLKNYSEHAQKGSITSAANSVSVFNKKGSENWPLDQFYFEIDSDANKVFKIEWRETKYVSVEMPKLSVEGGLNDSLKISFPSTETVAIKGEIAVIPAAIVTNRGKDVSKDIDVKVLYLDGTVASKVGNSFFLEKTGKAAIVYYYKGEEIASRAIDVIELATKKTFTMKEGPFSATVGATFTLPEMSYTVKNEAGEFIMDATDALRVVANYGAYTETVSNSYVQKIASDYTLEIYYGETLIAERLVKVTLGNNHKGNQIGKDVWETIPTQKGSGIKNYLLYNGLVAYRTAYDISKGGNVFYPVRGTMLNTTNLDAFKGLSVRLSSKDGKACLAIVINGDDVLTEVVMDDVDVSSGAEHVLMYSAQDEFNAEAFSGIRVEAYMDGKERINYLVPLEVINKNDTYGEYCLNPTWIFNADNARNSEIYVDGSMPYIYELSGEIPQFLNYNKTTSLPPMKVTLPDKVVDSDIYVNGAEVDIKTYVFSEKKAYGISYRYNGKILCEKELLCAGEFVFNVNATSQIQDPGTVILPNIEATEDGVDISQNVTVDISMGAKKIATLKGSDTYLDHNVVSELQLTYFYKGVEISSAEITVAPTFNIVADGSNWVAKNGAKTYSELRQYNARVNVTYRVKSNMSGIISIPMRGNNFNNVEFWDGLALRPGVRDCFLMNPLRNGDKKYADLSWGAADVYHVVSYQAVDVLNEDGTLKEIHVYLWVDGVPQSVDGRDYAVISVADSANFYDTFREAAPFIIGTKSEFEIVGITFGDKALLDYVAGVQIKGNGVIKSSGAYSIPYGTDYEFVATGVPATVTSVTFSKRYEEDYTLTELTELGEYTACVLVSAKGFVDKFYFIDVVLINQETGAEWTSDMISKLSANSVTTVYLGSAYTYEASSSLSGVTIEYYYLCEKLSGKFSTSTVGKHEIMIRFKKDGYKSYWTTATVELIKLSANDVTFKVTGADKATAGVAFSLPTVSATHNITGQNLTSYLVRSAAYGAYPITISSSATTYTSNVFGTITFTYKINGVKVGTKDVEVGYNGNLITSGSWSSNGILNNYTVYNARVNITFTVPESSGQMFFVPLRGTSTSVPWWGNGDGAMSFRIPVQRNAEWWWIYNSGNGLGNISSDYMYNGKENWLSGTQHTFSYQVKDVLNADGTIKEIRVYCWIDNVAICPGTKAGTNGIAHVDDNMGTLTGYFVVDRSNANWQDWFTKPANLLKLALTSGGTINTSSITIG